MHKTTDKTASRATRRGFFATSAVAGAAGFSLLSGTELARAAGSPEADAQAAAAYPPTPRAPTGDTAMRPFRVHVPEAVLADLRRRVKATRWPDPRDRERPVAGRAARAGQRYSRGRVAPQRGWMQGACAQQG